MVLRACQPLLKIPMSCKRVSKKTPVDKLKSQTMRKDSDGRSSAKKNIPKFFTFRSGEKAADNNPVITEESPSSGTEENQIIYDKFSNFIEEFIVLGVDKESLTNEIPKIGHLLTDKISLQPKVLYNMKNNFITQQNKDLEFMSSFLFPFGYSGQKLDGFDIDDMMLKNQSFIEDSENFYFFCVNSEETIKENIEVESPILKEANPSIFFHYFCLFRYSYYKFVSGKSNPIDGRGRNHHLYKDPEGVCIQKLLPVP